MIRRLFSFAVLVLAIFFPLLAWPCAVCVTGAADDPLTEAFNWSVLFLMATPYAIVASVGGWLAYTHWRAAAKKKGAVKGTIPFLRLAWMGKESER